VAVDLAAEGPALLLEARTLYRAGWPAPSPDSLTAQVRARLHRDPTARRELADALGAEVRGNRAHVPHGCPWCWGGVSFLVDCGRETWAACRYATCGWYGLLDVLIWFPFRRDPTQTTVRDADRRDTLQKEKGPGSVGALTRPSTASRTGATMHGQHDAPNRRRQP
jgi:hypothetical protein